MSNVLSPEKEWLILEGARTVFAAHGYEGGSMSRIARAAGVSKGTLYNYFSSKAELFAAYVRRACNDRLEMVLETPGARPVEDMLRDCALQLHTLMFSPDAVSIYRVVMAESAKFPELAQMYYEAGPQYAIATLTDWLAAQHQAGHLRVPDARLAAEQFHALARVRYGSLREFQLLQNPPPSDVAEVIASNLRMFLCIYAKAAP